jgi:hypothetical protein
MAASIAIEPLELGKRVMSILERGQKTATYKLATLTALIDYCVENPAAVEVPIDDLADRVIDQYWRQVQPFDGGHPLRQAAESARILDAVKGLRTAAEADKHAGMLVTAARHSAPEEYEGRCASCDWCWCSSRCTACNTSAVARTQLPTHSCTTTHG